LYDAFVTEAVDALVYSGFASTRKEAVFLGRLISKEYGLFRHVCEDYAFCDDFLLYHFNDLHEQKEGGSESQSSFPTKTRSGLLGEKADLFKGCVDVRDRTYRLQKYKSCFIGTEAVNAMVFSGLAQSRQEAVDLGRTLASELRLFRHVTGAHKFKDAYLFYQLRRDDDSTISSIENASDVSSNANSESVELLVEAFKQCVDVRDRKYRLKTHKQCFIGCGKNLFFLELRNLRRYMSSQRLVQYTHLAFCFQMP
jgi:hypothetical protein